MPVRLVLAGILFAAFPVPATAQDCDTGEANSDCDEDGFTVGEGDCDDLDPDVNPGAEEWCGNGIDDDCDTYVDERCDAQVQDGELQGGSSCYGARGWAFLLVPPLFLVRRRKA